MNPIAGDDGGEHTESDARDQEQEGGQGGGRGVDEQAAGAPSGFRVQGAGFRVQASRFRVQVSGCRIWGSGFGVQASKFRVEDTSLPADPNCRPPYRFRVNREQLKGLSELLPKRKGRNLALTVYGCCQDSEQAVMRSSWPQRSLRGGISGDTTPCRITGVSRAPEQSPSAECFRVGQRCMCNNVRV